MIGTGGSLIRAAPPRSYSSVRRSTVVGDASPAGPSRLDRAEAEATALVLRTARPPPQRSISSERVDERERSRGPGFVTAS